MFMGGCHSVGNKYFLAVIAGLTHRLEDLQQDSQRAQTYLLAIYSSDWTNVHLDYLLGASFDLAWHFIKKYVW